MRNEVDGREEEHWLSRQQPRGVAFSEWLIGVPHNILKEIQYEVVDTERAGFLVEGEVAVNLPSLLLSGSRRTRW